MEEPQVIQGSWEDLAAHAEEFRGRNDLLLIVPARANAQNGGQPPQNLAEALKDYVGSSHYGDADLSERTGEKFAKLLAAKYRKGQK